MNVPAMPALTTLGAFLLAGCSPNYSPDTYASRAVQQANKVEQGIVVGVRPVKVSAEGTVGTVTGSAAGGIAGTDTATGVVAAFGALGGAVVGGLAGSAIEHSVGDVHAWEYIVRKDTGELLSVTQQGRVALALGQKVLVITGLQARVVADYTVTIAPLPSPPSAIEVAPPPAAVIVDTLPPLQPTLPAATPAP